MITVSTENIDEPNNSIPIKTKKLSVATHNIRSLNDPSKQNILFSLYDTHHYDIIALQETNFNHDNTLFFNKSFPTYQTFFSKNCNSQPNGFGVSLSFSSQLAKHIFYHDSKYDRVIHAKLQFSDKQILSVINVYVPPGRAKNNTTNQVLTYVKHLLDDAIKNDHHIILLSDFNTDMD
jgi:exonuclease III